MYWQILCVCFFAGTTRTCRWSSKSCFYVLWYLKLKKHPSSLTRLTLKATKSSHSVTNSTDWSPYRSIYDYCREFVQRSKQFPLGGHLLNSHYPFFWWCIDIVRRNLMLINSSLGPSWLSRSITDARKPSRSKQRTNPRTSTRTDWKWRWI